MTRNQLVFTACFGVLCFWIGLWAGEERPAVELKPCPQAGKASLISATVTGQVCTYAEIVRGGGKFKWEIRKILPRT